MVILPLAPWRPPVVCHIFDDCCHSGRDSPWDWRQKGGIVTLCHVSAVTCHASRPRLKGSFVAGPRRKRFWTAWWAPQCTTPGYGRRESTEQVSSVHHRARSRLQPSQTFNKIWDIWVGADRRVISCQVLYEFQLLKAIFNLSFIKFLNSAELVRDTCIKTWIHETQSSELPANISICTLCAVHKAGVSVGENHDQSAIRSVPWVPAVLHYECGRSAAPLQSHYQPVSLTWIPSTVLGNVVYLQYAGVFTSAPKSSHPKGS